MLITIPLRYLCILLAIFSSIACGCMIEVLRDYIRNDNEDLIITSALILTAIVLLTIMLWSFVIVGKWGIV